MQAVLREFPWSKVIIYIDDIPTMEYGFQKLLLVQKVLQTLTRHGFEIKTEKGCWYQPSVEFLRHVIGQTAWEKSTMHIDKVDQFLLHEMLSRHEEIQGLLNFHGKFNPDRFTLQKGLFPITGRH